MNCQDALELLSAYYDEELDLDRQADVGAHLEHCQECAARLRQFRELSRLAEGLREPAVPATVWPAIESSLNRAGRIPRSRDTVSIRRVLAASLVAVAGLGLAAYGAWRAFDPHAQMARVFDRYLGEFAVRPEQADEILRARYKGQPLIASKVLPDGFLPIAPATLPGGYSRAETYVLDMPCCACTQTIYRNASGEAIALFEHKEQQRQWFGSRPSINAVCHGRPTFVVQLPNQLAATWQCGTRHLTVIGARNVEQVAELVAYLDSQRAESSG